MRYPWGVPLPDEITKQRESQTMKRDMGHEYRVVDVETTGLDPEKDRVCSIAWFDCDPLNGITNSFYTLIDPGMKIPAQSSGVHHIVDADVKDQPRLGDIWSQLVKTNRTFVAHNAELDFGFLKIDRPVLCTLRAAKHLLPDAPDHKNMTLRYFLGLDCKEIEGMPSHQANVDAFVTAKLLLKIIEHPMLAGMTDQEIIDRINQPIVMKTIPFGKYQGTAWEDIPPDYLMWMNRQSDWDRDIRHNIKRALKAHRIVSGSRR